MPLHRFVSRNTKQPSAAPRGRLRGCGTLAARANLSVRVQGNRESDLPGSQKAGQAGFDGWGRKAGQQLSRGWQSLDGWITCQPCLPVGQETGKRDFDGGRQVARKAEQAANQMARWPSGLVCQAARGLVGGCLGWLWAAARRVGLRWLDNLPTLFAGRCGNREAGFRWQQAQLPGRPGGLEALLQWQERKGNQADSQPPCQLDGSWPVGGETIGITGRASQPVDGYPAACRFPVARKARFRWRPAPRQQLPRQPGLRCRLTGKPVRQVLKPASRLLFSGCPESGTSIAGRHSFNHQWIKFS